MTYELAKKLKDAGFSKGKIHAEMMEMEGETFYPTLSELIEACGEKIWKLEFSSTESIWRAFSQNSRLLIGSCKGSTPEEAVANLWLELNKK